MFCIAYTFKGHVHVFAGGVKAVSHWSCRTSAIFKYFFPWNYNLYIQWAILTLLYQTLWEIPLVQKGLFWASLRLSEMSSNSLTLSMHSQVTSGARSVSLSWSIHTQVSSGSRRLSMKGATALAKLFANVRFLSRWCSLMWSYQKSSVQTHLIAAFTTHWMMTLFSRFH